MTQHQVCPPLPDRSLTSVVVSPRQTQPHQAQGHRNISSLRGGLRHLETFVAPHLQQAASFVNPAMSQNCLWIIGSLLGHACASTVVTLVFMYCGTLGLVLVGRLPRSQTHNEFATGLALWGLFFYAIVDVFTQSAVLRTARFLVNPDKPPGMSYCVWKVVRASWWSFAVQGLVFIGIIMLLQSLVASAKLQMYKVHLYVELLCSSISMTAVLMHTRLIYKTETVQGVKRSQNMTPLGRAACRRWWWRSRVRLFFRTLFTYTLPRVMLTAVTGVFVHISTLFTFETSRAVAMYLVASFAFKIVLQELVRLVALRSKVNDPRTMFAVTAIPTVLIDTQVCLMLQRLENAWTSVSGTILMSIFEVMIRVVRITLVHRSVRRGRAAGSVRAVALSSSDSGGASWPSTPPKCMLK